MEECGTGFRSNWKFVEALLRGDGRANVTITSESSIDRRLVANAAHDPAVADLLATGTYTTDWVSYRASSG